MEEKIGQKKQPKIIMSNKQFLKWRLESTEIRAYTHKHRDTHTHTMKSFPLTPNGQVA